MTQTTESMREQYLKDVPRHSIGIKWRSDPPPYPAGNQDAWTPERAQWHHDCMLAVLDCLTAEGVVAWPGDATSCVCQIIEAYARRARDNA